VSALDVTPDSVRVAVLGGCRDLYDLAARFGVLSVSPSLSAALDQLGVTVDGDGRLHGDLIFDQLTIDETENRS
jgi:hypothetical protein